MDEEMEDSAVEYTFTAIEIDLDYEFDAVRFFDFTREESFAEALQAELWFDTAETYPPSPFVARLIQHDVALLQNVNTSPKPKHDENVNMSEGDSDIEVDEHVSAVDRDGEGKELNNRINSSNLQNSCTQKFKNQSQRLSSGSTFHDQMMKHNLKAKTKSSVKPSCSRTSTLMKPTASQLAKQNQSRQIGDRFRKLLVDKNEKSSSNSGIVEIQAAKRQKLEGGHLCKVDETKQQTNFIHKEPKRVDANVDGNILQTKLRLTIPREPELQTAQRAQRMRQKTGEETENAALNVRRFRALPLNKKIFEAPSLSLPKRSTPRQPEFQEFHLKTSERAVQHSSGVSVPEVPCSNPTKEFQKSSTNSTAQCRSESKRYPFMSFVVNSRPGAMDASKLEVSEFSHNFKALPLNKKIFSSKGDMGVFRNSKRDVTVPVEFNFHTDKRAQHNPPIELFNKLSLTSEPQPSAGFKFKTPQPAYLSSAKGSKENRWDSFQHEDEVKHVVNEKLVCNGGKQVQFGSNGRITDVGTVSGRSLGIR
ncbi:hypothetical protein M9H77_32790 [Catharanthus roseus]|uniref:Uncharacterized protein n=1 Tax=Catharanthus roseus TaxID=4058 RepID=A0ACC0A3X3_CATRO|nr:hypothetical protein M9H77_32790 [Catharanthus roseus]